ncbi:Uma2 family endonuclease [Sphaerospermopsis sp. LEGE 00249]|uniref:Uma2 family endonuclease n=1 Tax=Sphaerospermopsis sp. LEGE 00249 TaxID=1380707 RepID=UPI00164E538D|nr:Uma2 family endonuclease [Sphaerospermopsis sp. LEGE 00249]MBC5797813.1 Uma2 family endonuclease [Sphaerospermopsis sp. LEGE 00249]
MDTVKLDKKLDLPTDLPTQLPDHTQLPCEDGTFVKNFQEHPQSILLTESIWSRLQEIHPDKQFCIGQDSGIYWRITEPPQKGAEAPDWFYVPDVPPTLNGQMRRSYVLWQEFVAPLIVIEFVSGNGAEERDETPYLGKFWVYEKAIRVPFYGIYEVQKASLELYHLVEGKYYLMSPNERGRYLIQKMGVELGIWQGTYKNVELPWLRWWDLDGNLLLTGEEQAEQERQRAEQEKQRAEQEKQRAEQEKQRAEQEKQRAEQEKQRADKLAAKLRQLGIELDE